MPIDLKEALGMMHLHQCIDELYHRNLDVAALTGSSNDAQTETPADSHGHDAPSQSLLEVTRFPDQNVTVVKYNTKAIDVLRPGDISPSSWPLPFLEIKSVHPAWLSPVRETIDSELHKGKNMRDILKEGAKAADIVNGWIQKETIRESGMACSRWHICLACGVSNMCTCLIPEPRLGWRRVCYSCLRESHD
ncbi:uncharacterized protein BKA78DRAFT_21217 [Phyllosticta capitalensis]|uniref:uncharacterized protein n=1 Tax=Phyllosticta capitalensis TaxID=121624 RepID=UPI00312F5AE9